jgi:GTP-binding protein
VGKSALFNRIVGRRIAIVHDEPGVTRDRITAEAEWHGRPFTIADTGGIGLMRGEKAGDVIAQAALAQVELAIEAASAIILVVSVQEGVAPLDRDVADRLRRSGKPVFLAVNKVDSSKAEPGSFEFAALGFPSIHPVSAIHGYGVPGLLDAALAVLPKEPDTETPAPEGEMPQESETSPGSEAAPKLKKIDGPLRIAIVGRPNVGKSSIINALTHSERVIVSPIPGTTRDAVDVPFEVETDGVRQKYILVDTAGVRQERRVDNSIEFYSVKRTEESIDRCDIAVFVIDAETGVTSQDKKVAGKIFEARRACILAVNKWDLVLPSLAQARSKETGKDRERKRRGQKKEPSNLAEFAEWVQEQLFFMDFAPVIFTSAKSGFHLDRLLESIRYVAAQLKQTTPTGLLNRVINDAVERRQPVSASGARLKFFYAAQIRHAPPTFLLFVNRDELFSDAYTKYLTRDLRKAFGYEGCQIVLIPRARPKTIESKRSIKHRDSNKPPERVPGQRRARRPSHKPDRKSGR